MQCETRHFKGCALAPLIKELKLNRDPDLEKEQDQDFRETMDAFYEEGDHFGDYDGPLTSASPNSMCF